MGIPNDGDSGFGLQISTVGTPPTPNPSPQGGGGSGAGARDATSAFEAVMLRQALEIMLPKTGEGLFGGGFAGETWRSMLAERLAETLAQRGGVGIERAVAATLGAAGAMVEGGAS